MLFSRAAAEETRCEMEFSSSDDLEKAKKGKPGDVSMVVLRGEEELEIKLQRGTIGIHTRTVYK